MVMKGGSVGAAADSRASVAFRTSSLTSRGAYGRGRIRIHVDPMVHPGSFGLQIRGGFAGGVDLQRNTTEHDHAHLAQRVELVRVVRQQADRAHLKLAENGGGGANAAYLQ